MSRQYRILPCPSLSTLPHMRELDDEAPHEFPLYLLENKFIREYLIQKMVRQQPYFTTTSPLITSRIAPDVHVVFIKKEAKRSFEMEIQDYVTIGKNVCFFQGGYQNANEKGHKIMLSHGSVVGTQSMIIGNITLGEGCVVLPDSIVTQSFPPYSVVGGQPARHVGTRCKPSVAEALTESEWWNRPGSLLSKWMNMYYRHPEEFLKMIHSF